MTCCNYNCSKLYLSRPPAIVDLQNSLKFHHSQITNTDYSIPSIATRTSFTWLDKPLVVAIRDMFSSRYPTRITDFSALLKRNCGVRPDDAAKKDMETVNNPLILAGWPIVKIHRLSRRNISSEDSDTVESMQNDSLWKKIWFNSPKWCPLFAIRLSTDQQPHKTTVLDIHKAGK